ncbi:ABC transporter permease [Oceanospirillum sediminis]|uniref:Arginine ABC transporter permease protein ArtM n=1 Tax=Oceanospirillum sediminis TaxID=2760088 RepID=A0A839IR52_9GAMM|nr:ABC transporter permease subunit [Oceanospirillum sediminis]MBB1487144.1 ABC transporter permease subunit [Oceanospirillum sediminis]
MPKVSLFAPHRLVLMALALILCLSAAINMDWSWMERYSQDIIGGLWRTLALLTGTAIIGFLLSIPLGLAQAAGPAPLAWLARGFCTLIRGTPILLQLWLLYYGLGSVLPYIPGIRQSWLWPLLSEAWPYAMVSLSLCFAGYGGEVMRGAFKGVPNGELEAAQAMGMHPFTILRRIWLPRAIQRVLPTLNGELIMQLKATPLAATIAFIDIYAVIARIRQETYIIYEPLLLLALAYLIMAGLITLGFRYLENRTQARR